MKRGIIALFVLMMLASCGNNTTAKSEEKSCCITETKATTADAVEVLYMHGKQRCATCIAIGKEAEAFVKGLGNDKVDNLTSIGFQYARNNPEQFKKNLSESIQKMLK